MKLQHLLQILLLAPHSSVAFTTRQAISQAAPTTHSTLPRQQVILYNEKPGSARFTGIQQDDANSGFDLVLRAIVSDVGSIVVGLLGLFVAVGYRLAHQDDLSVDTLGQETRTDLLAVFACGAVLLNGISKLDVTSALAESVVLEGSVLEQPEIYADNIAKDAPWALQSILSATPAMTAVLLEWDGNAWTSLGAAGTLPSNPTLRRGAAQDVNPILDRFLKADSIKKETYLPTLQAIPGRVEFTYLPPNTQEVLILPVSSKQVLVLGSNTAKSFTPRDVAWCQVIASRVGSS